MVYNKYKIFSKVQNDEKEIFCINYNDKEENYYPFIKRCHNSGYTQVIITSEIMIQIIEKFVFEDEYIVSELEFMEDDDFNEGIKSLMIDNKNINKYHRIIINELEFLSEKTSIEIKRIKFKKMVGDIPVSFFIQSNGILGVNSKGFDYISFELKELIKKELS